MKAFISIAVVVALFVATLMMFGSPIEAHDELADSPVSQQVATPTVLPKTDYSLGIVNRNANLRAGPGTNYAIVGGAQSGQEVEIVEQNADGTWYQLVGGEWIAAFLVDIVLTPTPTPTAVPPTLTATATKPAAVRATPTPVPERNVLADFTPVKDEKLGYSLAVPPGWVPFDLRSPQFQNMVNTFGLGDQLAPLNEFLDSPAGENLGMIYATDLVGVMFGGLPTALSVFVIPNAQGVTPDSLLDFVETNIEAYSTVLGDVAIQELQVTTINNIPGVRGSAMVRLNQVGLETRSFIEVAGLITNDKVYILTLATQESNVDAKEAQFGGGSF
ncbi:SH3 domain-containing protein [Chloroflexi bacterium TSY]|nr:SH3 domain-containing protein [Chloroflexi bacterium TSY]